MRTSVNKYEGKVKKFPLMGQEISQRNFLTHGWKFLDFPSYLLTFVRILSPPPIPPVLTAGTAEQQKRWKDFFAALPVLTAGAMG